MPTHFHDYFTECISTSLVAIQVHQTLTITFGAGKKRNDSHDCGVVKICGSNPSASLDLIYLQLREHVQLTHWNTQTKGARREERRTKRVQGEHGKLFCTPPKHSINDLYLVVLNGMKKTISSSIKLHEKNCIYIYVILHNYILFPHCVLFNYQNVGNSVCSCLFHICKCVNGGLAGNSLEPKNKNDNLATPPFSA